MSLSTFSRQDVAASYSWLEIPEGRCNWVRDVQFTCKTIRFCKTKRCQIYHRFFQIEPYGEMPKARVQAFNIGQRQCISHTGTGKIEKKVYNYFNFKLIKPVKF